MAKAAANDNDPGHASFEVGPALLGMLTILRHAVAIRLHKSVVSSGAAGHALNIVSWSMSSQTGRVM